MRPVYENKTHTKIRTDTEWMKFLYIYDFRQISLDQKTSTVFYR